MTINEAVRNLDNLLIACDQSGREAWQTLKTAALAQQANNSAMVQLLCDVKGLLLNHDTPSREARADVIRAINAVLAQQHQ